MELCCVIEARISQWEWSCNLRRLTVLGGCGGGVEVEE